MRSLTRLLWWAVPVVLAASCIGVVARVVVDHRDDERRRVAALEEQRRAAEVQLAKLQAEYTAERRKIPDRKPGPFFWDQPWPRNDGPPLLLIPTIAFDFDDRAATR